MNETWYAVVLAIAEIAFSLALLKRLGNAGAKISTLAATGIVWTVWLTTVYGLLSKGFFSATGSPQLSFSLAVGLPVFVYCLGIRFYQPLGRAIDALSTRDLLLLQYWRMVFGVLFFFTDALPDWFRYIGGLGDIASGIGARLALRSLQQHRERRAIINGNLIGILDFAVVLNLGVWVVLQDHSPDIMFNLIHLYAVPLFILLHLYSLKRLGKLEQGND